MTIPLPMPRDAPVLLEHRPRHGLGVGRRTGIDEKEAHFQAPRLEFLLTGLATLRAHVGEQDRGPFLGQTDNDSLTDAP